MPKGTLAPLFCYFWLLFHHFYGLWFLLSFYLLDYWVRVLVEAAVVYVVVVSGVFVV